MLTSYEDILPRDTETAELIEMSERLEELSEKFRDRSAASGHVAALQSLFDAHRMIDDAIGLLMEERRRMGARWRYKAKRHRLAAQQKGDDRR